jgi:hypothetical protein
MQHIIHKESAVIQEANKLLAYEALFRYPFHKKSTILLPSVG